MAKYSVGMDCSDDDLIGRVCELLVNGKRANGFQIAKRGKLSMIESEPFSNAEFGQNIAEYYFSISLKKLREIDSDKDKQDEFLTSRLPKIKTSSTVNAVIIVLELEAGESVLEKDVEYLWDMLSISGNDLIVPPFLSTTGKQDGIAYLEFVKAFLDVDDPTDGSVVCTVPSYLPHSGISELMKVYEGHGPNVFMLDFNGRKPFNSGSEIQMTKLIREAKKVCGEKFYMYGFDAKPCKQGAEGLLSEELMLSAAGFNAVGPRRTVPSKSRDFIEMMRANPASPLDVNKVFSPDDYGYHKLREADVFTEFQAWLPGVKSLKKELDLKSPLGKTAADTVRKLSKAFSYSAQLPEVGEINTRVKEQDLRKHLKTKVLPEEVLPKIDKMKRGISKKRAK